MPVDDRSERSTVEQMYGDWDYEAAVAALDRSLEPRPNTSLFDTLTTLGLDANQIVLDIGGRDARHSLTIAERFGCRVVCVDPAPANIDDAHRAIRAHESGALVEARRGTIEDIPSDDSSFDLVFCRDVMTHIDDIDVALGECARVLVPRGRMVMHQVFATELLEPLEARRLAADTASNAERWSVVGFEEAAVDAGFTIESVDVVGSEWVEASQEAGTVPNYLLQIARLRRASAELLAELGAPAYRAMYGNALWSIYQLIGKLESRVYVLRSHSSS